MSDPLSLVPLALAAGGGSVDGLDVAQLVAAGFTLLQRHAPLVRAMAAGRTALLLPNGAAFIVALAASEGRAALLLDPRAAPAEIARQLAAADARAVFTVDSLEPRLPRNLPRVLLDDVPRTARVILDDTARSVELGSQFGLDLEGEQDVAGSTEEAIVVCVTRFGAPTVQVGHSHRMLLDGARTAASQDPVERGEVRFSFATWANVDAFVATALAPLLAGAVLWTQPLRDGIPAR